MKNTLSLSGAESIEMTPTCAKDLTDRINSTSEDLAGMLKRAHDEKAWEALGYDSWPKYVAGEIKLCKSRVFQLLDHEMIRRELEESTIVDGVPLISNDLLPTKEAVTRELKVVPSEQRPAVYAAAVEAAGGQQPTAKQVEAAREEVLPPAIKQAEAKETEGEVVEEMSDAEWAAMKETNPAFIKAREVLAVLDQFPIENDWSIDALHDIEIRIREISKACWDFNSASAKEAKEEKK